MVPASDHLGAFAKVFHIDISKMGLVILAKSDELSPASLNHHTNTCTYTVA